MKKRFYLSIIPNQPAGNRKPLFFLLVFFLITILVGISIAFFIRIFLQEEGALVREKDVYSLKIENEALKKTEKELQEKLLLTKNAVEELDKEAKRIDPILDIQKLPNDDIAKLSLDNFTISEKLDTLLSISKKNKEVFSYAAEKLNQNKKLSRSIPSIKPVNGQLSKGYGYINDIFTDQIKFHPGITISARKSAPVYSAADGSVIRKGMEDGIGLFVVVEHNTRYMTKYGHLQSIRVQEGDYVKRGDVIGYVGKTGRVTGPCLYYEVTKNGKRVNPLYFIFEKVKTLEAEF